MIQLSELPVEGKERKGKAWTGIPGALLGQRAVQSQGWEMGWHQVGVASGLHLPRAHGLLSRSVMAQVCETADPSGHALRLGSWRVSGPGANSGSPRERTLVLARGTPGW